jgi:hypothetical protein
MMREIAIKLRGVVGDIRIFGPRALLFSLILLSLLGAFLLIPSVSAAGTSYVVTTYLKPHTPAAIGVSTTMVPQQATIVGKCVLYSITMVNPNYGYFMQVGVIKGTDPDNYPLLNTGNNWWFFCEYWYPGGVTTEHYYTPSGNNLPHLPYPVMGQSYTFSVQWFRGSTAWGAYIGGYGIPTPVNVEYLPYYNNVYWGDVLVHGESKHSENTMTGAVSNLQYAIPVGKYGTGWYSWDGWKTGYPMYTPGTHYRYTTPSLTSFTWYTV